MLILTALYARIARTAAYAADVDGLAAVLNPVTAFAAGVVATADATATAKVTIGEAKSSLIAMKTHAKRGWGKLRGTVIGAGGFKKKKKDRKKAMRERGGSLASSISTHGKGP